MNSRLVFHSPDVELKWWLHHLVANFLFGDFFPENLEKSESLDCGESLPLVLSMIARAEPVGFQLETWSMMHVWPWSPCRTYFLADLASPGYLLTGIGQTAMLGMQAVLMCHMGGAKPMLRCFVSVLAQLVPISEWHPLLSYILTNIFSKVLSGVFTVHQIDLCNTYLDRAATDIWANIYRRDGELVMLPFNKFTALLFKVWINWIAA